MTTIGKSRSFSALRETQDDENNKTEWQQDAATSPSAGCCALRQSKKTLRLHEGVVHVRAAIAVKLPGFANLGNQVQVEIGGEDFVFVA